MKRQMSLKWFLALSFLVLSVLLIIGYTVLSLRFYFRGMDRVIADHMAHAVKSHIDTGTEQDREQLSTVSGYLISRDWGQMPGEIQKAMDRPEEVGVLTVKKKHVKGLFSRPNKIFFGMKLVHKSDVFYICHVGTRKTAAPLLGRHRKKNLHFLGGISLLTAFGIFLVVWFLLRQVERPVKALGHWAKRLTPDTLHAPRPDFSYPELNELAFLIQSSLSSVQDSLAREHRFLRHSSHELRTPISVIRNNVELLQKLEETFASKPARDSETYSARANRQKKIVDRIDRASLTMQHLTETLLWLNRDGEHRLLETDLDLESLVRKSAAETEYLLKDKGVEIRIETDPFRVKVPGVPARIVTGNLIRNAFQHTWQGSVTIKQVRDRIEIINDVLPENQRERDLGFGLGLELSRQLCEKLGWKFSSGFHKNGYRALVAFGSEKTGRQ